MPENLRAHVIYEFQCPGCKAKYTGKTDRYSGLRLDQHSHAKTSAIGKHLTECKHFHFIVNPIAWGGGGGFLSHTTIVLVATLKPLKLWLPNFVTSCFYLFATI